ncbi:PqqD family protein [Sphingomonas sp. LY29]|uniref:PqqD family protein n=1 Tax=Sphingomonas sp. LY29 TaxID=3095341 RepID=UPI002D765A95|nr:PqqD family protein [Sphingomonas sp. LY29]WRP26239.1 PqqD family protein [Sphingomonas sp. LY29]
MKQTDVSKEGLPMTTYRRSPEALFENVDGDILALNVQRGACYGMENVTAEVWKALSEPLDLEGLCDRLGSDFDMRDPQCRRDLTQLLHEMVDEGLIESIA